MKKCIWAAVLLGGMLVSSSVLAQTSDDRPEGSRESRMAELEMRARELEIEAHAAELKFQNEVRELELEERRTELERRRLGPGHTGRSRHPHGKCGEMFGGFVLLCAVVNLLLAIWVYRDIRKRNAGSGLWIVITLLVGFFGALLYVITRLGDKQG